MYSRSVTEDQSTGAQPARVYAGPDQYRAGLYNRLRLEALNGTNVAGVKVEASKTHQLWRLFMEQGIDLEGGKTSLDFFSEYRSRRDKSDASGHIDEHFDWGRTQSWWSIGARADTQLYGPVRLLADFGHDQTMSPHQQTHRLDKATVALALNAGEQAGSRPTIRLFYTYAWWNSAARAAGGVFDSGSGTMLRQVYGNSSSGSTLGVQGEAGW